VSCAYAELSQATSVKAPRAPATTRTATRRRRERMTYSDRDGGEGHEVRRRAGVATPYPCPPSRTTSLDGSRSDTVGYGNEMDASRAARRRYRSWEIAVGSTFMAVAIMLTTLVIAKVSPVDVLDVRWATWLADHRAEVIEDAAVWLSLLGGGGVMWPVIGVVVVGLAYTRRSEALVVFALTMSTAQLFIGPLKSLVARARPDDALIVTSGLSFPSGHTVTAAAFSFGLVVALTPLTRTRVVWYVVALAWTVCMGLSRTVVGAHWLSDTIAGALYGCGLALLWSGVVGLAVLRRYPAAAPPATRLPALERPQPPPDDDSPTDESTPAQRGI
jgi:membrane-associated phospholipid phosphatase